MSGDILAQMGNEIADQSRVVMIERCGHWVSEEQPAALIEAIL
jgi:pimeloyl-ACP methyl ester carboxylesterase